MPVVFFASLMNLYEGAKTSVSVDSERSVEFEIKLWMHQGSMLSPFLFAVVVDVAVTDLPQTPEDDLRSAEAARGRRTS